MKRKDLLAGLALSVVSLAIFSNTRSLAIEGIMPPVKPPAVKPRQIKIDLDKAVKIPIPILQDLKPTKFKTPDGKECWAIRITGGRPIATPAYWGGMIFIGGGYGSHEFYAFDAKSGALIWKVKTGDDGPTAAVVENGYVAFNTESCTVYVLDARTGKTIWQEWLGDPLMSQPAVSNGRLYMAYPAGQRGHHHPQPNLHLQHNQLSLNLNIIGSPKKSAAQGSMTHRLLCADLKTGRHLWEQPIPADVISAPIVDGDKVYLACFDGTSMCLDAIKGSVKWKKKSGATSAPSVVSGQFVVAQKQTRGNKFFEGIGRFSSVEGSEKDKDMLAAGFAPYLGLGKGGGVALKAQEQAALDSSVGFASAPAAANLEASAGHVGVSTVVAGWAYQGSRAAFSRGRIMNAQGSTINSVRSTDGAMTWQAEAMGKKVRKDQQVFSPPALGKQNLYLCSAEGHLISVRQQDGKLNFAYATDQPITFQPALALGNMYAGTSNGLLLCVKTGNSDADGWTAWGGNAQHNKGD